LGGRNVLVVTDRGIEAAGHVTRAVRSLRAAGYEPAVFSGVEENPTTRHVDLCVAAARTASSDLLIGLGGGSSMDTAKGTNFLLSNGGKMADYWGIGKATRPMLPMIAVPTTAGTGSEAQSFALIADAVTHQKMPCGDKKAACKIAILDPEVTVSQPPIVTAVSGVDAMTHAIESYVTKRRNPYSQMLSREAWRMLRPALPVVLHEPTNLEARGRMLFGAHLAGAAIENSMLGAAHAAANPLTARYHLTHGIAVGIMLPHVIRFNAPVCAEHYSELAAAAGETPTAETLAAIVEDLIARTGLPTNLSDCGVERTEVAALAVQAERQWTGQFNPRPIAADDFADLYLRAL
jgi:alcohol dehydrogenase